MMKMPLDDLDGKRVGLIPELEEDWVRVLWRVMVSLGDATDKMKDGCCPLWCACSRRWPPLGWNLGPVKVRCWRGFRESSDPERWPLLCNVEHDSEMLQRDFDQLFNQKRTAGQNVVHP